MTQHDFNFIDQGFPAMRADMNNALLATVSLSSGATEPATKFAYQWWADTTANVLKQRNAGNTAWIIRAPLAPAGVLAKAADYTVVLADAFKTITIDATGGTRTMTLPAAASAGDGFEITFKAINVDNTVTLDGNGAETIDGAATITLDAVDDAVTLVCDGANWRRKADFSGAGGATKEFIVLPASQSAGANYPYVLLVGDFAVGEIDGGNQVNFLFHIPNDFTSLTDAVVVVIPDATETLQWDVLTDFGADTESRTANSDSVVDATLSVTVDTIRELDVSSALTGIAAGDYVGLQFESDTTFIRPFMLRVRYT